MGDLRDKGTQVKKIAIIGNMNNNGFSITRYFRLLGVDAHLFQYLDDGCGSLGHFMPECDTWEIDRWQPYIHRLSIPNAPTALLGKNLINFANSIKKPQYKPTIQLQQVCDKFEVIIGSGIAPAVLSQLGVRLDIFFPYSTGVEFIGGGSVYGPNHAWWRSQLSKLAFHYQRSGIQKARYVLNAEMGRTRQELLNIGANSKNLGIPMVFNHEELPSFDLRSGYLAEKIALIVRSDFSILAHASHRWSSAESDPLRPSKNNNWIIQGFSEFCRLRPNVKPLLILVDYGPDVKDSRRLIMQEGIEKNVIWLPKMPRREINLILSQVSVVAGEFITIPGTIWGGTGWEALAAGKPLLNGFNFQNGEFELLFKHRPPPVLGVNSVADVTRHLVNMSDDVKVAQAIGEASKDWFNTHNGISLAATWLQLLQQKMH